MRIPRLPIVCLFLGCLSFLICGGLQGCSNDAGTTGEDTNETSSSASDDYPLKVCVVSGEELGGMGEPYVHEHNGTVVKFCCKPCLKKFNKDPGTYLAKLEQ